MTARSQGGGDAGLGLIVGDGDIEVHAVSLWAGCIHLLQSEARAAAQRVEQVVVTDLVGLTARATAAQPPLVLAVDVLAVLGAAVIYVVVAAALVLGVTRRGLRLKMERLGLETIPAGS